MAKNGDFKKEIAKKCFPLNGKKMRFQKENHEVLEIGVRHGEKIHEVLCSREEMMVALDEGRYFRIPVATRDLNYEKYFEIGDKTIKSIEDYRSDNTTRLDLKNMINLLHKLPTFSNE